MTCFTGLGLALAGLIVAGSPIASILLDRCVCSRVVETNGWCAFHGVGYVGGLRIASAWLYEAVDAHGHQVDPASFVCPDCRSALSRDGFCETHRIGFKGGDAYFSKLTYLLARAVPLAPDTVGCTACRANATTHGWCDRCRVGMVGPFAFTTRREFDAAVESLRILEIANAASSRCDRCAVAILTDSQCPRCTISYRNGEVVSVGRTR